MNRILLIALMTIAVGSASAQTTARLRAASAVSIEQEASYWPLAVGNSWTYAQEPSRLSSDELLRIEVVAEETHDGRRYFRIVEMFGREALVRVTPQGRLVEWVPDQGRERTWYEFNLPEGGAWQPETGDECVGQAEIAARSAETTVPAGDFSSLIVAYQAGPCADAGVLEEAFAPGVGLVKRTLQSIGGPQAYELLEARIGGKQLRGPALSFGLRVDKPVYTPNLMPPVDPDRAIPVLQATILVENTTSVPLTLQFPSGQQYDLQILNEAGESVYFWSANKLFPQVLTELELSPGRETFNVSVPLGQGDMPLPAGRYLVEAWLTTVGGKLYSATVPIAVTEPAF